MLEVVIAIPFWFEFAAVIFSGFGGAMAAIRERFDIFGVVCIAIVTGLAGGILRDICLQSYGIYAFQNPTLILGCVIAGVVAVYFCRLVGYIDPIINISDTISTALYAISGTGKALSAGMEPVTAVILGMVSAIGGGIVRDVLMNRRPWAFQAGPLYVSAALLGSTTYTVMKTYHLFEAHAAISCVILILIVRLAAVCFNLGTRPANEATDLGSEVASAVVHPALSFAEKIQPPKGKTVRDKERARYVRVVTELQAKTSNLTSRSNQKNAKDEPVARALAKTQEQVAETVQTVTDRSRCKDDHIKVGSGELKRWRSEREARLQQEEAAKLSEREEAPRSEQDATESE